ncbi:energy-coupling factor ABC transporter ATP-binding protein [Aeribacillus pallidus]|uniref:energy-coupling factor ABC transporter ATP-binding protein n=1 Tax=Aeribacillus pallidus TaxID=33936 RepID=UPI0010237137|nr:energy-coupling factor ABC transporter ATP-binding protein [Aeribacillus pallidus]RZI52647.1 energy-coupling factor ABC transporter ATP-binding protein [Aeribacillus pallidus]
MDIKIRQLEHRYQMNTPFERLALCDINMDIHEGTYLAVIGHTGSGKSTILQHLNGLLLPTKGSIQLGDRLIKAGEKQKNLKSIRKKVGIVFQFPEHQLFEETVEKDIAFGPMNFGASFEEAKKKVKEVLPLVGLGEEILHQSPFELSGGQMRRVAIAGVLAMEPEVLVLDEPTAGLDPKGRNEIMELFYRLHKEKKLTTILVTHSMEDAAKYADEIAVLHQGELKMKGSPKEIFRLTGELVQLGLDLPESIKFVMKLEEKFSLTVKDKPLTLEETADFIEALLKEGVVYDR